MGPSAAFWPKPKDGPRGHPGPMGQGMTPTIAGTTSTAHHPLDRADLSKSKANHQIIVIPITKAPEVFQAKQVGA